MRTREKRKREIQRQRDRVRYTERRYQIDEREQDIKRDRERGDKDT